MFRLRIISLFLCIVMFIASQTGFPVFAEQSPTVKECLQHPDTCQDQSTATKSDSHSSAVQAAPSFSVWDIVKLIGATAFVLLLIYGLLRFMNQRGRLLSGKRGIIEHLGGTSVGTNRSVQLLKVGNRILVIGVGESIQLLREIDDEEEINEILSMHNEKLQQMLEPNRWISSLRAPFTQRKETASEEIPFRDIFAKQMQELSNKRNELLKQIEQKGTASDE
ncbi:flagella biosynthesis regulatory protein FliZ [Thermaerobacillus caldiproteolyticus]|uniref:flagella biosynthesis regulatory protein FliZ n=1 Tax=Thermaerobacillus caldiproteolyticus TaxID=247480 RepID=UPI00188D9EE2|nr:flagella biosynthesis regulatory protein FliZ [Anoxybacillus caldiproteolyticus]QPA32061.1 flagella biosynthesis regulatory protein FliZ [Anoxybacillus caldiproteolyticus]